MLSSYKTILKRSFCLLLGTSMILSCTACGTNPQTSEESQTAEESQAVSSSAAETKPGSSDSTPAYVDLLHNSREVIVCRAEAPAYEPAFIENMYDISLKLMESADSENSNELISPYSIWTALGMTANGAQGETLSQMLSVLLHNKEEKAPLEALNINLLALYEALEGTESQELISANSIWINNSDPSLKVEQSFLDTCQNLYNVGVFGAPFNEHTREAINQWVMDHTKNRIPELIDKIPEDAVLYLINSLSFDGKWEAPYDGENIHHAFFENEDETTASVLYMTSEEEYVHVNGADGFIKPYEGDYAMAAFLPPEGTSLSDWLSSLSGAELAKALAPHSKEKEMTYAVLPAFETEYKTELSKPFQSLGMELPFKCGDFHAMASADYNIVIGRILHQTQIKVDTDGTQAGAATAVEMLKESAPVYEHYVALDRPFFYVIFHQPSGAPVFTGCMRQMN